MNWVYELAQSCAYRILQGFWVLGLHEEVVRCAPWAGLSEGDLLHLAVEEGWLELVEACVSGSKNKSKLLEARNQWGNTPLLVGILWCEPDIVAFLLDQKEVDLTLENNRHEKVFSVLLKAYRNLPDRLDEVHQITKHLLQHRQAPEIMGAEFCAGSVKQVLAQLKDGFAAQQECHLHRWSELKAMEDQAHVAFTNHLSASLARWEHKVSEPQGTKAITSEEQQEPRRIRPRSSMHA